MTSILFTAAVLLGGGLLPAIAIGGADFRSLALAPLLTGLVAAAAGLLTLGLRTPILPWFVLGVVGANAVAVRTLVRRPPARPRLVDLLAGALLLTVASLPFLGLQAPDAGWDARLIFFLHARWFYAGGGYLASALANPAYLFAHPDYPPLIPATTASVWHLAGHIDMRMAQAGVTILNVSAVTLLAFGVARVRAPRLLRIVAAGGVALAAYGLAGNYTTDGYADLLWAAAAAAAVVYLLILPGSRTDFAIGITCAMVAALTKNEGTPAVVAILGLAAFRHRSRWRVSRSSIAVAVGVVAVLAVWPVLGKLAGAQSDLFGGGHSGGPLAASHDTWARLRPAWRSVWVWCRGDIKLAAVVAALASVAGLRWRRVFSVDSPLWPLAAAALMVVALVGAYVASPYDLAWHMGTSLDRTTIAPRLLLLTVVACWMLGAFAALLDPARPDVGSAARQAWSRWRAEVEQLTGRWATGPVGPPAS